MSHTGCWVWDVRSGAPVYWSAEMCRIHGRDAGEGSPSAAEYRALFQSRYWSAWMSAVQTCIGEGTSIDHYSEVLLPGGLVKYLRISGSPVIGAAGTVTEIIGSAEEVNAAPREDIKNEVSEDLIRPVIDLIPALVWTARQDGSLEYCNEVWLDYTGLSAESAMDWGWTSAIHPDDRAGLAAYWQSILAVGQPGQVEARLRKFDGEYRWFLFRARPHRDESGTVIKWYGTNTDIEDRKLVEEALRESARDLRQLVDSVPGMIAVADSNGQHEYANKRALEYTGTTVENSKGLGFINTIHPEDRDFVKEEWIRSNQLRQPMDLTHRWRRFDGEYRWFHVRVDPLLDNEGRVLRWYGLLTDIEDRRRAEEALQQSELHLRLLVETIPALLWRATPQGELDYVNQRVLDYTGFALGDLYGSKWAALVHPEDVDFAVDLWRYNCVAGNSHEITYRLRRSDGEYRWFQLRGEPLRDVEGRILNWYGLMLDINDRKRAEQALKDRESYLSGVLETIPALVSRLTPDGRLEYVNQRVLDYLGQPLERIGLDVIHPEDRDTQLRKWLNCRETGERDESTYRLRRSDGIYRWFFASLEPVRSQDGSVVHWYTVNIDIHNSKEMEEALRSTRKKLSTATQIATVAQLSAAIAHEINQPLASVVANGHACVTWLSSDPPNLDRARLTGNRIIRDGNAAAEVVTRIRALFKRAPPATAPSDINGIIGEVLRLILDEVRDSGIRVGTDLAAGLPEIVADRVQIQQTLINLLHNGIEAMADTSDRPKLLAIASRLDGDRVLIQVRDTGHGIPNDSSIFDPFFTTKESGMGMGLSICRSVIEGHGGRLWATPNETAGTTFSFSLPLHRELQV